MKSLTHFRASTKWVRTFDPDIIILPQVSKKANIYSEKMFDFFVDKRMSVRYTPDIEQLFATDVRFFVPRLRKTELKRRKGKERIRNGKNRQKKSSNITGFKESFNAQKN